MGQKEYERYVTHTFPASKLISHQHRLKTFSDQKVTKSALKNSEQDKKKVTMCLKKRLQAIADGQTEGTSSEQYPELPRAISDENGLPNKGNKSTARDFLEARYDNTLLTSWMGYRMRLN